MLFKKYFLSLCFLLFASHHVAAQVLPATAESRESENHERWYQVEMIVFSRSENNLQQQEVWPKNIQLSYPANLVTLKPADAVDAGGFTLLKANERQLNPQATTLARNGSVLFHEAWRQMIYNKKTSIFISGGKQFNGHQELEGSIDLNVAQYLQLKSNLWFTQFISAQAATTESDGWPELPAVPNSDLSSSEQAMDYVSNRIVKINQQRSMRSGEVHYLDHPLVGIIVKIMPYDAPNL